MNNSSKSKGLQLKQYLSQNNKSQASYQTRASRHILSTTDQVRPPSHNQKQAQREMTGLRSIESTISSNDHQFVKIGSHHKMIKDSFMSNKTGGQIGVETTTVKM